MKYAPLVVTGVLLLGVVLQQLYAGTSAANWRLVVTQEAGVNQETRFYEVSFYERVNGSLSKINGNFNSSGGSNIELIDDGDDFTWFTFPSSGGPSIGDYIQFTVNYSTQIAKIQILQYNFANNRVWAMQLDYSLDDNSGWINEWPSFDTDKELLQYYAESATAELPSSSPSTQPVSPTSVPSTIVNPSSAPSLMPAEIPTESPSTTSPSLAPSTIPSVSPSRAPTAVPTESPSTTSPSLAPSTIPSVIPSRAPTEIPTESPSTTSPSLAPSTIPSVSPSRAPTAVPTESPSTTSPSLAPSTIPSVSPSRAATAVPTEPPTTTSPSLIPTLAPTARPTFQPSSGPPSYAPTLVPTRAPTIEPTLAAGATYPPTLAPTSTPSLDDLTIWQAQLQISLDAIANEELSQQDFYSLRIRDEIPYAIYGDCEDWSAFVTADLVNSAYTETPTSITMTLVEAVDTDNLASSTFTTTNITCNDASNAADILSLLTEGETPSATLSVTQSALLTGVSVPCNGNIWRVRMCSPPYDTVPAMCIDCSDPCMDSGMCYANTVNNTIVNPFLIAPCGPVPNCSVGRIGTQSSAISLLQVEYTPSEQPPEFLHIDVVEITTYAARVNATLTSTGTMYCGAFLPTQDVSDELQFLISDQGFSAYTNPMTNVSSVVLSDLVPSTAYDIYCYTESEVGNILSETLITNNVQYTTTSCCKSFIVSLDTTSVVHGSSNIDILTIEVSHKPSDRLYMSIILTDAVVSSNNPLSSRGFAPSDLIPYRSGVQIYHSSLYTLSAGIYALNVSLSGNSADEYEIEYENSADGVTHPNITVYRASEEPPTPELLSARYSNSGAFLQIRFSSNTDRGGTTTRFTCSELFNFTCASTSRCQWVTNKLVNASVLGPVSNDACAGVDDPLSLLPDSEIRATCHVGGSASSATASCTAASRSWSTIDTSAEGGVLIIQAPTSGVAPRVALTLPSAIGMCDVLTLDLTSSSGSGGRDWTEAYITVSAGTVDAAEANIPQIQAYIDANYTFSPPISLPAATLLQPSTTYSFTAELCNFLGNCAQVTRKVNVLSSSVPTVTILGRNERTISRGDVLKVSAVAYLLDCSGTVVRTGLHADWSVFTDNSEIVNLASQSRNQFEFRLDANTLSVNTLYTIEATVVSDSTQTVSTAEVQVYVQEGAVVAVLAGGVQQSVRVGESLTLDASQSFDEDVEAVTAAAAGLVFSWSCVQINPSYNDTCGGLLSVFGADTSNEALYTITVADSAASGAQLEITVEVTDATQSRVDERSVTITVLSSTSPRIASLTTTSATASSSGITGEDASVIVNPSTALLLSATVILPSQGVSSNYTWGVNDESFALASVALTGISRQLLTSATSSSAPTTVVYLSLARNALDDVAGSTLTFFLTCDSSTGSATASITVEVNLPPEPGTFSITPASGAALSTAFTFTAQHWKDDHLPLSYEFGYISSSSGVDNVMQSKSFVGYGNILLPAGSSANDNQLSCYVQVIDVLDANTSDTQAVTVVLTTSFSVTNISSLLNNVSDLTTSVQQEDIFRQTAALTSYLLNIVNCTNAPSNCTALGRSECADTAHTCGPCLSDDYFGSDGDSNEPCYLTSLLDSGSRIISTLSSTNESGATGCSLDSDCDFFEECVGGICYRPLKECPANCSGNGRCSYVFSESGDTFNEGQCLQGDSECTAVCECDVAYMYSTTCHIDATESSLRRIARGLLVDWLELRLLNEDADADSIVSWTNILAEMTRRSDEMDATTLNDVYNLTSSILSTANANSVLSYTNLLNMLESLNKATIGAVNEEARRRRRRRLTLLSPDVAPASANAVDEQILMSSEALKLSSVLRKLSSSSADTTGTLTYTTDGTGVNVSAAVASVSSSLKLFSDLTARDMVPGQAAIESLLSEFRLSTSRISAFLDTSGTAKADTYAAANLTLSAPRSSLQRAANSSVSSVVLVADSANVSDSFAVSVVSLRQELLGLSENDEDSSSSSSSSSDDLFLSNPLELLLDGQFCISPPCLVVVTLQYTEEQTFTATTSISSNRRRLRQRGLTSSLSTSNAEVVNVTCTKDVIEYVNHTCSCGTVLNFTCNGTAGLLEQSCPVAGSAALCNSIGSSSSSSSSSGSTSTTTTTSADCSVVAYSSNNVTCSCTIDSTAGTTATVSYVAMLSSTLTTFTSTYTALFRLSASDAASSWRVISVIAAFLLIALLMCYAAHWLDKESRIAILQGTVVDENFDMVVWDSVTHRWREFVLNVKKRWRENTLHRSLSILNLSRNNSTLERAQKRKEDSERRKRKAAMRKAFQLRTRSNKQQGATAEQIKVDKALPRVMRSVTFSEKFAWELRRHHRWFGVFFHYSEGFSRLLRVVALCTNILTLLFFQAIFYDLTNLDDGSCSAHTTESACLAESSEFASGEKKCGWSTSLTNIGTVESSCWFIEPDSQLRVILFVAVVSALLTVPVAVVTHAVLKHVLAPPTLRQNNKNNSGEGDDNDDDDATRSMVAARARRERPAGTAVSGAVKAKASGNNTATTASIFTGSSKKNTPAKYQLVQPYPSSNNDGNSNLSPSMDEERLVHAASDAELENPGQQSTGTSSDNLSTKQNTSHQEHPSPPMVSLFHRRRAQREMMERSRMEMFEFTQSWKAYRDELGYMERKEFDQLWCLNANGIMPGDEDQDETPSHRSARSSQQGVLSRWKSMLLCRHATPGGSTTINGTTTTGTTGTTVADSYHANSVVKENVYEKVLLDLNRARRLEQDALQSIRNENSTEKEVGEKLLFYLQCDLLPGLQGHVLESKGVRDGYRPIAVSSTHKLLGWLYIILLNVFFVFFIVAFSVTQTSARQSAWFKSFCLWLVVEILLLSTNAVLITHILIPSIAVSDLHKVKEKLLENIRLYQFLLENDVAVTKSGGAAAVAAAPTSGHIATSAAATAVAATAMSGNSSSSNGIVVISSPKQGHDGTTGHNHSSSDSSSGGWRNAAKSGQTSPSNAVKSGGQVVVAHAHKDTAPSPKHVAAPSPSNAVQQDGTNSASHRKFNASAYLFASQRLAQHFPDLKEAQIVKLFSSPFPHRVYRAEVDVTKQYDKSFSVVRKSILLIVIQLLSSMLSMPHSVQDTIVDALSTIFVGYLMLWHIQLYNVFPPFAFIPLFLLISIVHFSVQSYKSSTKLQNARYNPIRKSFNPNAQFQTPSHSAIVKNAKPVQLHAALDVVMLAKRTANRARESKADGPSSPLRQLDEQALKAKMAKAAERIHTSRHEAQLHDDDPTADPVDHRNQLPRHHHGDDDDLLEECA